MAVVRAGEASSFTSGCYDVFLSFRGKDTPKTFTDYLYTALKQAGIHTFRDDDEIERGENIQSELQKAIKESKISIIVFSKDYASSNWFLDELVMILDRKRTSQHVVLPVFYHVRPSEVRNQSGAFAKAFARYEEQFKEEANERKNQWMEKVKGWSAALREVADLGGMELQNQADGHESKFIQNIIKEIKRKLSCTALSVPLGLIGIDSRAKKVNLWVQDGSMDVGIVAICGMSGIGKTTIAKYVYNLNFGRFEGSSFLASIKEASEQPNGLVHLQRQLLSDILRRKIKKIWNVDEGIIQIKNAICGKRVLVVLDDVDQAEQLAVILRIQDGFYPGSKIIITTRHEQLLEPHEVLKVHKVEKFEAKESFNLFSWHAFGQYHPVEAYMQHSTRVVYHCEGLPLALQVLGSSLLGKSVDVWKSAVEKLESIRHSDVLEKLKISYDSLQDDHDKDLFLHIACFFIGEEKDFMVKILDQCDFYTTIGIQNLIDRCLLTIANDNKLMMHRLIREMGREIIRQESPKEAGKRSRLWHHMDSFEVLKEKTGTKRIEGLILDMRMIKEDKNDKVNLETDAFVRMKNLRILQLNCVTLSGCYEKFPKRLRWLCWHGFPLKILPSDFPVENLVVLDLSYSSLVQVWQGTKIINRLKILNLSHCHKLARTPNFSGLSNSLETLILNDCVNLVEVHKSIGNLKRLVFLNLKDCKNLRKLPENIGMLKFLKTLDISGCSNLAEFLGKSKMMECLKMLQVLHAGGIAINRSLSRVSTNTRDVNSWPAFNWFQALKPRSVENFSLASLVCLTLSNCNLSDDAFPRDLSNLSLMKELDLSNNPICSLPYCVKGLRSLKMLVLEECRSLQSLLGLPNVRELELYGCNSLEKITYQSTSFRLLLEQQNRCEKLVEIQGFFKLEPISKVDAEMINYMGLSNLKSMGDIEVEYDYISPYTAKKLPIQGLHEFGIFSTFVPGRCVPGGFSYEKSSGSSISFTVPSPHNLMIRGLNVYFVYTVPKYRIRWWPTALYTKISNRTKNLNWIYSPICYGCPENNEDMVWLSHWPFGNQLEGGDQVHVSIIVGDAQFQIKECGVNFVYDDDDDEEEEERKSIPPSKKRTDISLHATPAFPDDDEKKSKPHNKTHISSEQVIGGDLSRYQSVSVSAYFLCHLMYGNLCWKSLFGSTHWAVENAGGAVEDTESAIISCSEKMYRTDTQSFDCCLTGMEDDSLERLETDKSPSLTFGTLTSQRRTSIEFWRRMKDFLHFVSSCPMKSEAEVDFHSLNSKFFHIDQQVRELEDLSAQKFLKDKDKYRGEIERGIPELISDVATSLAMSFADIKPYIQRDMPGPPEVDTESTSSKSEEATRKDRVLPVPQAISNLAIEFAIRQISKCMKEREFRRIGISGFLAENVAEALKGLRNMFNAVLHFSVSLYDSMEEIERDIARQINEIRRTATSKKAPLGDFLLLLDCVDEQLHLHHLEIPDDGCLILISRSSDVYQMMDADLVIRMGDHLLLWDLFCENVGQILVHSSTLQDKAVRLIEGCHGHLLAIILLARALKDETDVGVWDLALHELTSQLSGMSEVMVHVLSFIWGRKDIYTKNCIQYCASGHVF